MIGAGMLMGLQTVLFSEQDGNGPVSCLCDYYVCQLRAKPGYLSEQNQAYSGCVQTLWFGLVQLYFQYLDVWVEFVRMVYLRSQIAAAAILALTKQHRWQGSVSQMQIW